MKDRRKGGRIRKEGKWAEEENSIGYGKGKGMEREIEKGMGTATWSGVEVEGECIG